MRALSKPNLKVIVFLSICVLIGLAIFVVIKQYRLKINWSDSMPIGIYKEVAQGNYHRDDIVVVCLPIEIAKEGVRAGYIGQGNCPGQTTPLIKKLIALPGDKVMLTSKYIMANKRSFPIVIRGTDDRGQMINQYVKMGSRISKGYWLYGSGNPTNSWDSRYYGAVPYSSLRGTYAPVWIVK